MKPLRGRRRVWLFDLDNTLHDASHAAFGALNASMTRYIAEQLRISEADADHLRRHYWQRYGATLIGLMRHHGVSAPHFLHETHRLPGLEDRLRIPAADRAALARLPGVRIVLTNAPAAYARRVLDALRLTRHVHAVLSIEDMHMFGNLRPKPDARMLRRLCVRLGVRPTDCTLVEDSLANQRSARTLGMRTVWMQRYLRDAHRAARLGVHPCHRPPYVCARIKSLLALRQL